VLVSDDLFTDRDAQLTPAQLLEMHPDIGWEYGFAEAGLSATDVLVIRGLSWSRGDYAEQDLHCYGTLKDGRWFILSAGCDTTGWDCQAGGEYRTADSYDDLVRLQMTSEERVMFLDAPLATEAQS
jgi:hypothetical protein